MNSLIASQVIEARKRIGINDYPGNLFKHAGLKKFFVDENIILMKEDLDKLSGFIAYGKGNLTVICLNYKRPIGHQNFTLAHEVGHWFVHNGLTIADSTSLYTGKREQEASRFASELLYPKKNVDEDYAKAIQNGFYSKGDIPGLAAYIDKLCHRYCLSYDNVLRTLCFRGEHKTEDVRQLIENSIGDKISAVFDKNFYTANEKLPEYQKLMEPYIDLENKLDKLVVNSKISKATAESVKMRNGIEISEIFD